MAIAANSNFEFTDNGLYHVAGTVVDYHLLNAIRSQRPTTPEVIFADDALAERIRTTLGLPAGAPIYQAEMQALITLVVESSGVSDLTGLEYATSIIQLALSANELQDISPLSSLQNLTHLILDNNDISDLSPVSNLPVLKVLAVNYNNITDISPVNNIVSLETLGADGNNISDISSLTGLVNMQQFSFVDNNISDISVVQNYPNLLGVYFSNNPLSSIEPLRDRTTLQVAVLNSVGISDFSVLADRESLGRVEVSGNNVTDISFIRKSKDFVVTFIAESNNITDLSPLTDAVHLKVISLYNNPGLQDISPLENAPMLVVLGIPNTAVTDLATVNKHLVSLLLAHDHITDFSTITNIKSLQEFHAVDTEMEEVSFLKDFNFLVYVTLDDNHITDLRPLSGKLLAQLSVVDQYVVLNDTQRGQATSLSLFGRDGNVPQITWLTPGSYDPATETVTWDNTGANFLTWYDTDGLNYVFSGTLQQFVNS